MNQGKLQREVHYESVAFALVEFSRGELGSNGQVLPASAGRGITAQQTIAGVKVFRLRAGETGLGLFDATEKRAPGVPHHTFDIEGPSDAQELIKELESKAIKTDGMRMHGQGPGYSVYVIDPGGNRLELSKD